VPNTEEAQHEYGIELRRWEDLPRAQAVVMAVAHREFTERPLQDYLSKLDNNGCFIDVKSQFDRAALNQAGLHVWRL